MTAPFGPRFIDSDTVEFSAFAPKAEAVTLLINDREIPMIASEEIGMFALETKATAGMQYGFKIDNGPCYPDPATRYQPSGVHEKSELIDLSFPWKNLNWKGVLFEDLIIYELHIGTFTEKGTFLSAIDRLDELVELGVTSLEIMPVAQAAGNWNWGYDGVNLFAPANYYGRPEDLIALVDAAHARGLAMILDVVYNHFGPEGNYLFAFGGYLSSRHKTPWGDSPNFDEKDADATRAYILENVRYWLEEFKFDGLRVDATHFIRDDSIPHIVTEIGSSVRALETKLGRTLHLIGESNVYDPELISKREDGGSEFDGLWCDEFLHSLYAQLIPEEDMTSREYRADSDLRLVLHRGYVFHGTLTSPPTRHGRNDAPSQIATEPLICSIQNHDFIGNHPNGKRLHQAAGYDAHRAAAALLIMMPSTPMLFMGEEFASESPFYFFVDFQDQKLRKAVERGRKTDHPQHDWENGASATSTEAFLHSKIGETNLGNADTLDWYKKLIALRKGWRQESFLNSNQMEAEWDEEREMVHIVYSHEKDQRFIIVRLHEPNRTRTAIPIKLNGEILLTLNCDDLGDGTISAGPFAVLAGKGTAIVQ